MQPVEAAEIEQPVRLARAGRHDLAAQRRQAGIAVRHHRRQPVQRAAQDHHDEALLGRRGGQRQRRAGRSVNGARSGRAGRTRRVSVQACIIASGIRGRSAAASSPRGASRRGASPRSVAVAQQRAEAGVGQLPPGRVPPTRPDNAIGPVDPAHHRLRRRPSRRRGRASRSAAARSTAAGRGRPACPAGRASPRSAAGPARAALATTKSSGVRSLAPRLPGRRQRRSAPAAAAPRSPPVSRSTPSIAAHRVRRRIVGDEMPHQLGGEEAMRRRVVGEEVQAPRRRPPRPAGSVRPITICSPGSCARGRKRKPGRIGVADRSTSRSGSWRSWSRRPGCSRRPGLTVCSSRHSRARFSFRPRWLRWPAGLSGPTEPALSR